MDGKMIDGQGLMVVIDMLGKQASELLRENGDLRAQVQDLQKKLAPVPGQTDAS